MNSSHRHRRRLPRTRPRIWMACALAAGVLVLGANGTLAGWSQATITNSANTAVTAKAVILSETSGATTCSSSDVPATNASTCTTINKYGGTATPLTPGAGATTTMVTFKNIGLANASSFTLTPGSCSQSPAAGTGVPAAANICTSGDVTIAVSCSPGSTFNAANQWTDLSYVASPPPTSTKTHAAAGGDLNAGST